MPRSTASFIAYDLRPSKQAERRMLVDFLGAAGGAGLPAVDCRYVGMGGFKFYDFILMHRYVGVKTMISLERDAKIWDRCKFNRPYGSISVLNSSVNDFVKSDKNTKRTIFWLDYDDSLGELIVEDIQLLGTKIGQGSFAFVTVAADVPSDLELMNETERLEVLGQQFGELALAVTISDVEDANFPMAVYKILFAAFKNAFAGRTDGMFFPEFRLQYRDSTTMLTIGGVFTDERVGSALRKRLKKDMPFLVRDQNGPYKIRNFNLSERERHLIEVASTKSARSRERRRLLGLGIKTAELNAYRDLVRFMPRYFETIF